MSNNFPSVVKNNFLKKITNLFKKIFGIDKKEIFEEKTVTNKNIETETNKQASFISDLKKTVTENNNKLDILSKIDKNPELLYSLPIERLEQLSRLYSEQINILDNDILKISNDIKKLQNP